MARIVSLIGFLPPARYDSVAWTHVQIEEAAAEDGPFALIDTQALPNPDPDPSVPAVRNITTALAALTDGWYRVTFTDNFNGQSDTSEAIHDPESLSLPPTPAMIRNGSPLLRAQYPIPNPDPYASTDLANLVTQAVAYVSSMTFRILDPELGCSAPDDYVCELVPPALVPVAIMAVTRVAERLKVTTNADYAAQVATGRRLRGFTAGPYSESYFAPGEFARRGAAQGRPPMDPDDAVDVALWALATEDARDYFVFRATGVTPPIGVATAFDYRRQSLGYGFGGGLPFGAHGGPDGF